MGFMSYAVKNQCQFNAMQWFSPHRTKIIQIQTHKRQIDADLPQPCISTYFLLNYPTEVSLLKLASEWAKSRSIAAYTEYPSMDRSGKRIMLAKRTTSASACELDDELVKLFVSASASISTSSSLDFTLSLGGVPARVPATSHGARPIACKAAGPPISAISFSPGRVSASSITFPLPVESKSGPG